MDRGTSVRSGSTTSTRKYASGLARERGTKVCGATRRTLGSPHARRQNIRQELVDHETNAMMRRCDRRVWYLVGQRVSYPHEKGELMPILKRRCRNPR